MPEIGGGYLLTLDVPNGAVDTEATVEVTIAATGSASSPTASADDAPANTAWSATYTPITAAGWHVAVWTVTGTGAGVKSARFYVIPGVEGYGVWPPSLSDLKLDMGDRDDQDDSQDDRLSMVLDAAIAHVRRIKATVYDVAEEEVSGLDLAAPPSSLVLGTLRLAARLHSRRGTFDNMIRSGDASVIVASYDSDIERLLQTGRFLPMSQSFA